MHGYGVREQVLREVDKMDVSVLLTWSKRHGLLVGKGDIAVRGVERVRKQVLREVDKLDVSVLLTNNARRPNAESIQNSSDVQYQIPDRYPARLDGN